MNYSEVINLALSYSDRTDSDLVNRMGDFLRIVEARVNRAVRVRQMAVRTLVITLEEQRYYGLPKLFGGVRDITLRERTSETGITLCYVNPEQMNSENTGNTVNYTIIADQIQISPPQNDKILEIVYYQLLDPLTSEKGHDVNWLSDRYPDVYVFALLIEIEAFVKNPEGANMWEQRYQAAIAEIDFEDAKDRWSGTPMTIKVG